MSDERSQSNGSARETANDPRRIILGQIEAYARGINDAINRRDWESPVFHLVRPQFQASALDVFPPTETWEEHLNTFKAIVFESPGYMMEIKELSVDLAPTLDSAKVYITAIIHGRPPEITRESLGVVTWERHVEGWRMVSHVNMRLPKDTGTGMPIF